ncbi:MAG: endonuclease III [Bacilli bacterium]
MKQNDLIINLDKIIPDAKCELLYNKDYELLIATMLSAQSTDKRVNEVTKVLFSKYDIFSLVNADKKDIERIIYPVGTYNKKSGYVIEIVRRLVSEYNGVVPNSREFLESLPGVGRKTCNVVLANIFNVPTIAVDTHMIRVTNRLDLVNTKDVLKIEEEMMKFLPIDKWNRVNHQLILFGRYICKSQKPDCDKCPFITCKNRINNK